jgi:hypothetical protein
LLVWLHAARIEPQERESGAQMRKGVAAR